MADGACNWHCHDISRNKTAPHDLWQVRLAAPLPSLSHLRANSKVADAPQAASARVFLWADYNAWEVGTIKLIVACGIARGLTAQSAMRMVRRREDASAPQFLGSCYQPRESKTQFLEMLPSATALANALCMCTQ